MIREYRDQDAEGVRACVIELQDYERELDRRLRPGESMADEYLTHTLNRCSAFAGTIIVAEVEGTVAGFVTVLTRMTADAPDEPPGEYALVSDLIVRGNARRRGLGTALLQAAERCARNAGAADLRIGVLSGNEAAIRLYRRLGFAPYLATLSKSLNAPET